MEVKPIAKFWYNSRGKYKATNKGKIEKSWQCWNDMFKRCYVEVEYNPTYEGCTVSEDWWDYQNFAEWFSNLEYCGPKWQLDKDIILRGNKVYGPDRCAFVPREINNLFTIRGNYRGNTPCGVIWHESLGRYEARCSRDGKSEYLGLFPTRESAFARYKEFKEDIIKDKAEKYKALLDPRVYDSLLNWVVSEND